MTQASILKPKPKLKRETNPASVGPVRRTAGNPFLEGPYAPVKEETTATRLKITGELPKELNGMYVRIGPNPIKDPDPGRYHWFTGDGMVHGLRLREGQAVWYGNRWIGSRTANKALKKPPTPGKTRGIFDTVNTNVYGHAGRIWASVEAGPVPVELDAQLASVRHNLFGAAPSMPFTAHPHLDPITGDLHAISYDAIKHGEVYYQRINAQGQLDKVVTIPVKHGPMIHDCAITRSQVIVLDLPVTFSWSRLIKRLFPYAWNTKHDARVGLLPRDGGPMDIRWFDVDPCYVFHPCNAFDLPDGTVILDVVAHARMFDQSRIGPERDGSATFERWTLPAGGHKVIRQVISRRAQEFPRLDERLVGQPYRYAYAAEVHFDQKTGQSLLKHDLQQGGTVEHAFGLFHKPGEFVFVPKHARAAEDEGWLVGFAYNLSTQRGEFHVVDAQNMTSPAQAIVEMPVAIPMGFHGNWIADSSL